MIDVSQFTSYSTILLVIFGALLILGFLKGVISGFLKTVIKFVLWVVLIIGIVMFAPNIGDALANTQFLENLIAGLGNTEITEFVLSFVGPTLYTIVAGLLMLIVGAIVIGIILLILRSIFKKKNALSRILAGVCSLAFNMVIVTVLFIISTSPLLFKGAQEHVDNNQVLSTYQEVIVEPVQGILQQNNIPSNVEEITLVALKQEPTQENTEKFFRLLDIMSSGDLSNKIVVKDENGNITGINETEVKVLYSDIVFGAKIINDLDASSTKDSLSQMLQSILGGNINMLIVEGHPIATVQVDAAEYDAMNVYMTNLGFDPSLIETVNSIFIK